MRFEHRELLWYTLLVLPALTAFFWWSWRKRRQLIAQFVQSRLLAHLTVGVSARRQKLRLALLVAASGLLMVALARPQWGFSYEEARQRGLDVVVAIDTSRSMLAADVAPNRLSRAKLAALDLKRLARTDRVGLVAFAGSAFLQCPLSFDDEAFRQNVTALDVNIIPQGGSALAEAIDAARSAFERKGDNHKVLVLFTDGEDNAGEALDAAKKAAEEGMRIFTVGVGTPNGELLRISDGKGRTDYIRDDQGNVVKSRLNEKLLRAISEASHGFYMLLAGANTMELLYERGLAPLPKSDLTGRHVKKYHERYQWFLGLAIMLLLIEMFMPQRKRVRREAARGVPAEPSYAGGGRLSGTLRPTSAVLLLLMGFAAEGSPARGLKQYQAGRYESALREYRNALRDKKEDPRLHFNAGTAAYQAQNYEKAVEYLNSALITPDLNLQQSAYYNRGNALYRLGEATSEPQQKMQQWEDAVASYESALKLNPNDADAKFNHDLVQQKLEELKKQQQQQQQQQSKDDQKKDDQKKDEKDKQEQKNQEQQQQKPDQQQQEKEQQQQEEQKKQQQDQAKKEEQKKEQSKEAQSQKGDKDQQSPQSEGRPMRAMPMTEQQALQLLDTQKGEERPMIFIPPSRTNRHSRVLKDW